MQEKVIASVVLGDIVELASNAPVSTVGTPSDSQKTGPLLNILLGRFHRYCSASDAMSL